MTQITNFNISVAVTDAFMEAVEKDADVRPDRSQAPARSPGSSTRATVWDKIIHGAWRTGEPGVFFIDEANHYNPVPHLGEYEATNPCGEQPLLPYDVCNLGSINVGAFVKNGRDRLGRVPPRRPPLDALPRQRHRRQQVPAARRSPTWRSASAASGSASWASPTCSSGSASPYDSDEGVDAGPEDPAVRGRRGEERVRAAGRDARAVPGVGAEHLGSGRDLRARRPTASASGPMRLLRNCNVTTVAPTGTISIIAGCSLGHRAAVRRGVHAQPGRRADAGRERGLRRDREEGRAGTPTT